MTRRERAFIESWLQEKADKLRETAEELRTGKINQYRAANRLKRIASELAKEKKLWNASNANA